MSEETLNKVKQMVASKFEYEVFESGDAALHHYLLVPYLLLRIIDRLDLVNNSLIDIESSVDDLDPRKGE